MYYLKEQSKTLLTIKKVWSSEITYLIQILKKFAKIGEHQNKNSIEVALLKKD